MEYIKFHDFSYSSICNVLGMEKKLYQRFYHFILCKVVTKLESVDAILNAIQNKAAEQYFPVLCCISVLYTKVMVLTFEFVDETLINQSINQSIHSSIHPAINQLINHSISQSISQSVSQSITQSINQSINPTINFICSNSRLQLHGTQCILVLSRSRSFHQTLMGFTRRTPVTKLTYYYLLTMCGYVSI